MTKGKRKRRGPKHLWSLVSVALGLVVLVLLIALQNAGYLKTQVRRTGTGGSDYQVAEPPTVTGGSTGATWCETPTPRPPLTTSPQPTMSSSPRVQQRAQQRVQGVVEGCLRGGEGPLPRNYVGAVTREKIKVPIDGRDLPELTDTACGNWASKSLGAPCGDDVLGGCAWPGVKPLHARFNVMYDIISKMFNTTWYAMAGGYVHDGSDVAYATGAYPAAKKGNDQLRNDMKMQIWELSPADRQKISEGLDVVSQAVVLNHISNVERHEETHWKIFQWTQDNYVQALNNPPDNFSMRTRNPADFTNYVDNKLYSTLKEIKNCEKRMHEKFEEIWDANEEGVQLHDNIGEFVGFCSVMRNEDALQVPRVEGCPPSTTTAPSR
ncbi:MAG: hypothetical protein A3E37_03680 [Candidatus Andersenbacteria bacterium RIFCSPHIGHO2_12_FULL_46_9]|nr:MAG: hypothetical protein A3I08_01935 [Candidatus Andersenbacteria bacterium RIFCSPLOWO2_02_FULL_46_11]OGY37646.1 MAG: hypothetical protein A3E37_03680 [Candidatus Andersenbacteria bacterium RIFCSPHIGHO2_12_FULL_46_9]HBE90851.1 hypothetical protein [Candidatus Andersenbacteria bacterium]